jgi:hypothetical protein
MPRSAIAAVTPDYLGTIEGIADYIIQIAQQKKLINYIKNEYDLDKNSNRVYCLRNGTFRCCHFLFKILKIYCLYYLSQPF